MKPEGADEQHVPEGDEGQKQQDEADVPQLDDEDGQRAHEELGEEAHAPHPYPRPHQLPTLLQGGRESQKDVWLICMDTCKHMHERA